MMTPEEIYSVWAPESSIWSPWVAPVLFTRLACVDSSGPVQEMPTVDLGFLGHLTGRNTVIVIDLPGARSVEIGIQLVREGYRPVPLYNGLPGSGMSEQVSILSPNALGATVDVAGLMDALCRGTRILRGASLASDAPPTFLLDSDRLMGNRPLAVGMFDNRWRVFPQNLPSGRFLLAHEVQNALLISLWAQPREDLAHVLLRWQDSGIKIYSKSLGNDEYACVIQVSPPSRFRRAWYRVLAIVGLRRNSAGGFGGIVPDTSAG